MSLLNFLCYEQICDEFWYAKFYEYKIIVNIATGFFNATHLCETNNKDFSDWKKHTEPLRKSLMNTENEFIAKSFEVDKPYMPEITGNYYHYQFITDILSWINIKMYKKVNTDNIENALREFKCTVKKNICHKHSDLCNLENISNKIPEYISTTKNNCKKCHMRKNHSNE